MLNTKNVSQTKRIYLPFKQENNLQVLYSAKFEQQKNVLTTQTELILFSCHPEFGRECVCCWGLAQVHQAGGGRAPLRTKTCHQP